MIIKTYNLYFNKTLCTQSLSCVWLFATPQTVAHQAQTLSMGFPKQEYWSTAIVRESGL